MRFFAHMLSRLVLPGICCGFLEARAQLAPQYELVEVAAGVASELGAETTVINNRGVVGGTYLADDRSWHAFLYRDGVMQDITPPGSFGSSISDLNDAGQFVSFFSGSFMGDPPLERDPRLGPTPWGLNNAGTLVGSFAREITYEDYTDYVIAPFVYKNGVFTELPVSDEGRSGQAWRVNNRGLVIGNVLGTNGNYFGVLYRGTNLIRLSPLPGDNWSASSALNDWGQVVGISARSDGKGRVRGFMYWLGQKRELPALWGHPATYPMAINRRGEIVGWSENTTNYVTQHTPFLISHGRIYDVNWLIRPRQKRVRVEYVHDINDRGWIVGSGTGEGFSGAVLLKPIKR